MSDAPLSFEWLPTPKERLSQAKYLMRRPLWRRISRIAGIYLFVTAILAASQGATDPAYPKSNLIWMISFGVYGLALLIRPAIAFPWLDSVAMLARRLTVDDRGILVQDLGLRLYPHRTHWSRLGPLEAFQDGYGLYIDGGYSAFWIPRRVIGDRKTEFCEFVSEHQIPQGSEKTSKEKRLSGTVR